MESTKKKDWGLIIAGLLMVFCAVFIMASPGLSLVTLTAIAGAGFLITGIFDIVNFVRFRESMNISGWAIAYGVLDIIIGLMFLLHPLAFAGVIPWVAGAFLVIFGIFEVIATFSLKKTGVTLWGWMLFSGIISILCGVTFFVSPASFSIFLAVFVIMRGVSLLFSGWNTGKSLA